MSRSPSSVSSRATPRQQYPSLSNFDQQDALHSPEATLRPSTLTKSPSYSPLGIVIDDDIRDPRDGAYTNLNRPASRMDVEEADNQSLLHHGRIGSRAHVKRYDRMDSWTELLKTGAIKFFITLFFGGILCLCLKSWEGFHHPIALSVKDVRIFNALTIAISICLGLNLLASLKRYAVILRWSILTRLYVSMEVFDLVLGIEDLTNVAKLLILSIPWLRRQTWLLGGSQLHKNMKSGTNGWYPFVCCIWLLINIGSQVLVASLSLFWPMEPYRCLLATYGDVSVADMSRWADDTANHREAAWRYGMDAQSWGNFSVHEDRADLSTLPGTPIYKGDGYYEYRFFYRNPHHPYDDYSQTNRSIQSRATCDKLKIHDLFWNEKPKRIFANINGQDLNVSIPSWSSGSITWIGHKDNERACGPRCARLTVMQLEDDDYIDNTSLWFCTNTVSHVDQKFDERMIGMRFNSTLVNGTDSFAAIAAGAISWTGFKQNNWKDRQFRVYPQGTPWSPETEATTAEVQDIIMRHTIGAIAAFDDHGIRYNIHINNEACDRDSQRLNVSWRYIAVILGAIALIQLAALGYLLARANHTIVRDASFFSTAMLLKPVIDVLKDEIGAMSMSGTQIKNHPLLRSRKIRYSYKRGLPGEPMRITVSFEDEDKGSKRKKWPSGDYT